LRRSLSCESNGVHQVGTSSTAASLYFEVTEVVNVVDISIITDSLAAMMSEVSMFGHQQQLNQYSLADSETHVEQMS
jgi:hypothetical protein